MIKLDNVSVEVLTQRIMEPRIEQIIYEYDIVSIQDLIDCISTYPEYDMYWDRIKDRLDSIISDVKKNNEAGKTELIFHPKEYEDASLNYTDTFNYGDKLLLSNPINTASTKFNLVSINSIDTLKRDLKLTKANGLNYLISKYPNIGINGALKIVEALDMYTEQVERQAKLLKNTDTNVFSYQYDDKKLLVQDHYPYIIDYLMESFDELIWGKLNDYQKKFYLNSIEGHNYADILIRKKMIDILTNYTTIEELEDFEKKDYKVLSRFAKK